MLLILALLFLPCAVVGAFVTTAADDHDLLAFQSGGALFTQSLGDGLCGRSSAVAKSDVAGPARAPGYSCARSHHLEHRRVPSVTMLVNDASSLPSIRSLGSSGNHKANNEDHCSKNQATLGQPSSLLIWPSASAGGVLQDIMSRRGGGSSAGQNNRNSRKRGRGRAASGSEDSDSALKAMAIPARCALPSVDLLREAYGPRRSFWGDLSARETRIFYKELLPVSIKLEALAKQRLDRDKNDSDSERGTGEGYAGEDGQGATGDIAWSVFGEGELTLEEQARLASTARHAARLYARERCSLPLRVVAHLYDGLRHLKNYGTFRVTGMTWNELWAKYEAQVREENPLLTSNELRERVCLRILEKSCCTSEAFDNLAGLRGKELENIDAEISKRGGMEISRGGSVAASVESTLSVGGEAANQTTGDCTSGSRAESKDALRRASRAESAAALAGVLRLTRLVKPFSRPESGSREEGVDGDSVVSEKSDRKRRRRRLRNRIGKFSGRDPSSRTRS